MEEAVRDIGQRAKLLEAGIMERKERVIQTLQKGKNVDISPSGSGSGSVRFNC